jgi:predicted nucleic-acid-binding protein
MMSFDTNVAVRLVVEDDPEQCERAERAFRRAIAEGGAFFSATVLVEVAWVLRVACKQDRATVAAALRKLVGTAGVTVERSSRSRRDQPTFPTTSSASRPAKRAPSRCSPSMSASRVARM